MRTTAYKRPGNAQPAQRLIEMPPGGLFPSQNDRFSHRKVVCRLHSFPIVIRGCVVCRPGGLGREIQFATDPIADLAALCSDLRRELYA